MMSENVNDNGRGRGKREVEVTYDQLSELQQARQDISIVDSPTVAKILDDLIAQAEELRPAPVLPDGVYLYRMSADPESLITLRFVKDGHYSVLCRPDGDLVSGLEVTEQMLGHYEPVHALDKPEDAREIGRGPLNKADVEDAAWWLWNSESTSGNDTVWDGLEEDEQKRWIEDFTHAVRMANGEKP